MSLIAMAQGKMSLILLNNVS